MELAVFYYDITAYLIDHPCNKTIQSYNSECPDVGGAMSDRE